MRCKVIASRTQKEFSNGNLNIAYNETMIGDYNIAEELQEIACKFIEYPINDQVCFTIEYKINEFLDKACYEHRIRYPMGFSYEENEPHVFFKKDRFFDFY